MIMIATKSLSFIKGKNIPSSLRSNRRMGTKDLVKTTSTNEAKLHHILNQMLMKKIWTASKKMKRMKKARIQVVTAGNKLWMMVRIKLSRTSMIFNTTSRFNHDPLKNKY